MPGHISRVSGVNGSRRCVLRPARAVPPTQQTCPCVCFPISCVFSIIAAAPERSVPGAYALLVRATWRYVVSAARMHAGRAWEATHGDGPPPHPDAVSRLATRHVVQRTLNSAASIDARAAAHHALVAGVARVRTAAGSAVGAAGRARGYAPVSALLLAWTPVDQAAAATVQYEESKPEKRTGNSSHPMSEFPPHESAILSSPVYKVWMRSKCAWTS